MNRILRVTFCVLAVLCAAVTIFFLAYFGVWGLIPLGGAVLFGGLMYFFKLREDEEERRKNPPPPEGDFITGRVPADTASKDDKPKE